MNAAEVLEFAKQNDVVMVDVKFTDWPGQWQHFSVPLHELCCERAREKEL